MSKVNCQIVNILLNDNNEFTKKYTSFSNGSFEYENIIEDYFENKGMRSIKIDNNNQSICFGNAKEKITFFNPNTKNDESYFEEVHIHCNDLYHYDSFVDYLYSSKLSGCIDEVDSIPHHNDILREGLKNCELVMEPMTNEVSTTKTLVNILSQRSDETIFRALAIHFCGLVDNIKDIDSDLIHNLDDIFHSNVVDNEDIFFSSEIADKLINIGSDEKANQFKMKDAPSNRMNIETNYTFPNNDKGYGL